MQQARQVWDSVNRSHRDESKNADDLLELGYLKLIGGALDAFRSKVRDIRTRDVDVFEMANEQDADQDNSAVPESEEDEDGQRQAEQPGFDLSDEDLRAAEAGLRSRRERVDSESDESGEDE
ncbi:unnamed protein product [Tilletia controversa]|nr:unnamed protein product [Tilletia controversa]CAD6947495.1 unnamed protein product [Tilletia controversa]CAD6983435.1 unnamed protein product [Tilletia controversa]